MAPEGFANVQVNDVAVTADTVQEIAAVVVPLMLNDVNVGDAPNAKPLTSTAKFSNESQQSAVVSVPGVFSTGRTVAICFGKLGDTLFTVNPVIDKAPDDVGWVVIVQVKERVLATGGTVFKLPASGEQAAPLLNVTADGSDAKPAPKMVILPAFAKMLVVFAYTNGINCANVTCGEVWLLEVTVSVSAPTFAKLGELHVNWNFTTAFAVTAPAVQPPIDGDTEGVVPKPAPMMVYDVGSDTAYSHVGTEATSTTGIMVRMLDDNEVAPLNATVTANTPEFWNHVAMLHVRTPAENPIDEHETAAKGAAGVMVTALELTPRTASEYDVVLAVMVDCTSVMAGRNVNTSFTADRFGLSRNVTFTLILPATVTADAKLQVKPVAEMAVREAHAD
jgi:hypothetical protein